MAYFLLKLSKVLQQIQLNHYSKQTDLILQHTFLKKHWMMQTFCNPFREKSYLCLKQLRSVCKHANKQSIFLPEIIFIKTNWWNCSFWFQEGTWTWLSGAQFEYSNWLGGRPLNGTIGSRGANCLFLFGDTESGKRPWLDAGCNSYTQYPLCMKLWESWVRSPAWMKQFWIICASCFLALMLNFSFK